MSDDFPPDSKLNHTSNEDLDRSKEENNEYEIFRKYSIKLSALTKNFRDRLMKQSLSNKQNSNQTEEEDS